MKQILVFIFTLLVTMSFAQITPFTINSSQSGVQVTQVSPNNALIGATVVNEVTETGQFGDNFAFWAHTLWNIPTNGTWNFPIMGDVQVPLEDGQFSLDNIRVGLYPWRIISGTEAKVTTVFHGGVSYATSPNDIQTFKTFIGIEFALPSDGLPTTFSVNPTYQNRDGTSLWGAEGTVVVPLTGGLGAVFHIETPFKEGEDVLVHIGVARNLSL